MADLDELAKERLQSFGYEWQESDAVLLAFALDKVVGSVKNDCNVAEVPEGLRQIGGGYGGGRVFTSQENICAG